MEEILGMKVIILWHQGELYASAFIPNYRVLERLRNHLTQHTHTVKQYTICEQDWVKSIGVATVQLEARPDPQRLFDSMWNVLSILLKDQLFASDVAEL
eukprot:4936668-Amphidinium_carterae.1